MVKKIGKIKKATREELKKIMLSFGCAAMLLELFFNYNVTGFDTTSRTAYVKSMDDYHAVLAEAEFYRTEELERKTKNDAALYGYRSATQFSSLMNLDVSHFYQAVGMEGGKNFYCVNGATPLLSAMLSLRYVIADNAMEANPIRTLVAESGNTYLYENKYVLPLGFMMDEDVIDAWDYSDLDEIEAQNRLASESVVGESTIDVQEDAYIFATYESTTVDSMTEEISDGRTKSFTKVSHGYTLDLGYCTAGTQVRIKNSNEERVNITAYALNLDAADTAYQTLNEQTMEMTSFSDTKITGTIDVKKEGRLIFAVADDAGWKLYVDGEQTDPEVIGEAFISTYLTEGTHTVELRYQTPGFMVGAGFSLACILIVILIAWIKRHH